jgi:glycosyltransferase involved in cell wall biosynthesis
VTKHLGVDAERLSGRRAGVARYLAALLGEWATSDLPFDRVTLYSPTRIPPELLPARHPFSIRALPAHGPRGTWTHWTLARAAREADVLFCPSYVIPLAYRGPAVVTIHDTIHETMPETFPRRTLWTRRPLYRLSARRAALVLTDSESSKRDLECAYGLPEARLRAIPLGVGGEFRDVAAAERERVRDRYGLGSRRIVLFVGKLSRRRNLPALVRAFAEVARDDALLVLAGDNHLGLPLEELARELGIGDGVRLLGHVPDGDLPGLYAAATVFAYPSSYEGFGLPVVEAMAAGTAVLTVDNSSLGEVAGDAALLVGEVTVDALADGLARLLDDDGFRHELERRGEERSRRFTWAETARRTVDAIAQARS